MQIGARRAPRLLGPAAQQFREQIVGLGEVRIPGLALVLTAARRAGVVPIILRMRRRGLRARGVDLAGVVAPPFFRVRQQIVGGGDLLELLLRMLVSRVEVRVQLFRQNPIGFPDLLGRGGLGDAKDLIGIFQARLRCGRERR